MLSIIVPARNARQLTINCLDSLGATVGRLLPSDAVEYVLLDDDSDPAQGITSVFLQFRRHAGSRVRILRFRTRQHYTGVFAHGLSLAEGENVLFVSNDMMMSSAFLRTVLAVSALDRTFGIVRGRSAHCDSHREYSIPMHPSTPPRSLDDVNAFAEFVASYYGLQYQEDELLSGDCVLIRRELIDAVGVMDTRFFGYFGDPDYGLRAQRAGFKLVCALGAWLHHEGAGHVLAEVAEQQVPREHAIQARRELIARAFVKFREKWGPAVATRYESDSPPALQLGVRELRAGHSRSDYIAPLPLDPTICEVL